MPPLVGGGIRRIPCSPLPLPLEPLLLLICGCMCPLLRGGLK